MEKLSAQFSSPSSGDKLLAPRVLYNRRERGDVFSSPSSGDKLLALLKNDHTQQMFDKVLVSF